MKRVLFIGLGSIGIRHLINLSDIFIEDGIDAIFDAVRIQNLPLPKEADTLIHHTYTSFDDLNKDYDIAFICNPTNLHLITLQTVAPFAQNFFIEKPVFSDFVDFHDNLSFKSGGIQYVACPLRYTAVLQYIKEFVNKHRIFAARAICSTYLPNWRPKVDYRNTYSAHIDQGGGVSIDLIHEWDYINWLFGFPKKICNFRGTYSNLELDSDDHSIYIASYSDKLVSLSLDYFGRFERREIELYLEDDVIIGDIQNQKILFLKEKKEINFVETRDDYQKRELRYFLELINGRVQFNTNSIDNALKTLSCAKGII